MAKKKSRRPNLSQETLERARAELRGEKQTAAQEDNGANTVTGTVSRVKPTRPPTSLATRRIPTEAELRAEYSYVLKDLRKMAYLTAALFAFIVIAAIVMPLLSR